MDESTALVHVRQGLNQPDKELYFAPIRHHSPACAWALRCMIRELKPRAILIEAPADFESHIDLLLHEQTKPPVAIASLIERDKQPRVAGYYPFCSHSPEFIALQEGRVLGADLRFIDLPTTSESRLARQSPEQPFSLQSELRFGTGDYIKAICQRLGCRDGYELWDHLFESRLGEGDWRSFFADVGSYCAGLRAATLEQEIVGTGDEQREQFMAEQLLAVISRQPVVGVDSSVANGEAANTGPLLVVIGGFHAPALIDYVEQAKPVKEKSFKQVASQSYLIRYSFAALDALNGYAAGLPQPGYYDELWQRTLAANGQPQWQETAKDLVSEFAQKMRAEGHPFNVPAQVELLRIAQSLAHLRGREGITRHDLIDGVRSALIKGEASTNEAWTERLIEFLRGTDIGDIPHSAGSPPLVEDVRRLAKQHRFSIEDSLSRKRKLDIRRKPSQLAASRFLHAMSLLDAGFASCELGPDFITNHRADLLFEEWSYAWSPTVEGILIELSVLGDQINSVCIQKLHRQRIELKQQGKGRDLDALVVLFARGVQAGLGQKLLPYLRELQNDFQENTHFSAVAQALKTLHNIAEASGPMGIPPELDLTETCQQAFARLLYLIDDLPNTPIDVMTEQLEALSIMVEMLRSSDMFDVAAFDEAINRIAEQAPPAEILGAVLGICVQSDRRKTDDLLQALNGTFFGALADEEQRIGVLRGVLHTVPGLLWRDESILNAVDHFLSSLEEQGFLQLLPHLRLAFTKLNPRETDRLAKLLGDLHGVSAGAYSSTTSTLSEQDLQRGLAVENTLLASFEKDSLSAWLFNDDVKTEKMLKHHKEASDEF